MLGPLAPPLVSDLLVSDTTFPFSVTLTVSTPSFTTLTTGGRGPGSNPHPIPHTRRGYFCVVTVLPLTVLVVVTDEVMVPEPKPPPKPPPNDEKLLWGREGEG